jgi:hypothetical protein
MDEQFYLFSEYRDGDLDARHYICGDFHLWVWSAQDGSIAKFEFHYKDRIVKYFDGAFARECENYIMPVFFLIEQLFNRDPDMQASLLALKENYSAGLRRSGRGNTEEGLRHAI